jgi:hypothetical protein
MSNDEGVFWGDSWWPSLRDALDGPEPVRWWLFGTYDAGRQWRRRQKLKTGVAPDNLEVLEYLYNKHRPRYARCIPDLSWYINPDNLPDYHKYRDNHINTSTALEHYGISKAAFRRRRKDGWSDALILLVPDQGDIAGDRRALAEYAHTLLTSKYKRFATHPLSLDDV